MAAKLPEDCGVKMRENKPRSNLEIKTKSKQENIDKETSKD